MQAPQQRIAVLAQIVPRQYERAMLAAGCVKTLDHSAWLRERIAAYFLTQMLLTVSVHGLAWPTAIFASIKFAILAVTLGWLLMTWLGYARLRPHRPG